MSDNVPTRWSCLYEVASSQKGYFTSSQAISCGYTWDLLTHHTKSGKIERVRRGLYRIRDFPGSPHEEMMADWLTVGKKDALVSHESALELLDLSDVISSSTHVTVPRKRRSYKPPDRIELHTTTRNSVFESPIVREGIRLTPPARAIADAAASGMAPEQVERAVRQAIERGLTTRERIIEEAEARGGRVREMLCRAAESGVD